MVKKTINVICAKVKTSTLDESFDNDKCTWQTSTGIKPRKTLWEYSRVKFVATSSQYFFFCWLWYPSHVSQGIRLLVPQVVGYGKAFDANDHTITSGLSSMTTHLFQHFMAMQKHECHSPFSTYSPDLILCDFFPVLQEKFWLKGYNFDMIKEIQNETQAVFVTFTLEDN